VRHITLPEGCPGSGTPIAACFNYINRVADALGVGTT